jgi:hypothetical protein
MEKQSASQLGYLFAYLHLLSSDFFSSLTFFLLLFYSLVGFGHGFFRQFYLRFMFENVPKDYATHRQPMNL